MVNGESDSYQGAPAAARGGGWQQGAPAQHHPMASPNNTMATPSTAVSSASSNLMFDDFGQFNRKSVDGKELPLDFYPGYRPESGYRPDPGREPSLPPPRGSFYGAPVSGAPGPCPSPAAHHHNQVTPPPGVHHSASQGAFFPQYTGSPFLPAGGGAGSGASKGAKYTLIANVPYDTVRQDLVLEFRKYGRVELAMVVCDEASRHPHKEWTSTAGYAFVRFAQRSEAAAAIQAASLGLIVIRGTRVRADWARKDSYAKRGRVSPTQGAPLLGPNGMPDGIEQLHQSLIGASYQHPMSFNRGISLPMRLAEEPPCPSPAAALPSSAAPLLGSGRMSLSGRGASSRQLMSSLMSSHSIAGGNWLEDPDDEGPPASYHPRREIGGAGFVGGNEALPTPKKQSDQQLLDFLWNDNNSSSTPGAAPDSTCASPLPRGVAQGGGASLISTGPSTPRLAAGATLGAAAEKADSSATRSSASRSAAAAVAPAAASPVASPRQAEAGAAGGGAEPVAAPAPTLNDLFLPSEVLQCSRPQGASDLTLREALTVPHRSMVPPPSPTGREVGSTRTGARGAGGDLKFDDVLSPNSRGLLALALSDVMSGGAFGQQPTAGAGPADSLLESTAEAIAGDLFNSDLADDSDLLTSAIACALEEAMAEQQQQSPVEKA